MGLGLGLGWVGSLEILSLPRDLPRFAQLVANMARLVFFCVVLEECRRVIKPSPATEAAAGMPFKCCWVFAAHTFLSMHFHLRLIIQGMLSNIHLLATLDAEGAVALAVLGRYVLE